MIKTGRRTRLLHEEEDRGGWTSRKSAPPPKDPTLEQLWRSLYDAMKKGGLPEKRTFLTAHLRDGTPLVPASGERTDGAFVYSFKTGEGALPLQVFRAGTVHDMGGVDAFPRTKALLLVDGEYADAADILVASHGGQGEGPDAFQPAAVVDVELAPTGKKAGKWEMGKRPRTAGEALETLRGMFKKTGRPVEGTPFLFKDPKTGKDLAAYTGGFGRAKGGFAKIMLVEPDGESESARAMASDFMDLLGRIDPGWELVFQRNGLPYEIDGIEYGFGAPPEATLRPWGELDEGLGDVHEFARCLAEDELGVLR